MHDKIASSRYSNLHFYINYSAYIFVFISKIQMREQNFYAKRKSVVTRNVNAYVKCTICVIYYIT